MTENDNRSELPFVSSFDSSNLSELPKGWVWTKLQEIAEINPRLLGNNLDDDMEVSFLPMKAVEEKTGKIDLSDMKKVSEVKKGYTPFRDGDILFAKITPCMENGKIAVVKNLKNGIGFGSTEFHVIRLGDLINKKLLFFFLLQDDYRKVAQRSMTGSAGQLRVPIYFIENTIFALPPLPEQHRIVAKIEELFTRLDAGMEALKKVKAQLKRYRQAALKSAFGGKLTREWREAHKNELELASVLLEKIKEERRKIFKAKYKELPPVDTSNLPELTEGWTWARVGDIGEVITGTTPSKNKKEYYGSDYPFFKPTDLNAGYYVRGSEDGLSKDGIEYARLLPEKSVLVTCIGATIGKTGFIRISGASNQQINAVVPFRYLLPEFIYYVCISPKFQKSIIDTASATTLPILNKGKFEILPIPLASLTEQHKIVEEIESRFSMTDEVEKVVEQSLRQAERLRQSILKKAFEGKLIPQDPSDEPAEKLLERIKEEKAKLELEGKTKKKVKKGD